MSRATLQFPLVTLRATKPLAPDTATAMPLTIPPLLQGVSTPDAYLAAIQKDPAVGYNHWLTTIQYISEITVEGTKLAADNQNLQTVVTDLESQNASFAAEISTLKTVIAEIKDMSAKQQHSILSTSQPRLSPKHPDPDKFSGNKDDLLQFTTQLNLKLNINADHFTVPKSNIAYAISRLEGNALAQVLPHVKSATEVNIESIDAFLKILEVAFGDPDKKGTAQRKIRSLRQTHRPFHEYLADFQRYIVDTGYDDEAKLASLIDGLSQELKSMLVYIPTPKTMEEAIGTFQSLENRRKMFAGNTYNPGNTTRRTTLLTTGNLASNASTTSSTRTTTQTTSTTTPRAPSTIYPASSVSNYTAPDPMDLSSSRPRGPLSTAERERRISLGLCLYCGGSGHVARNCPNLRKTSRLAVSEATTRVEEVVSGDEEQGKV